MRKNDSNLIDSDASDSNKNRNLIPHSLNGLLSLFSGEAARGGYLAAIDQGIISVSNFLATLILARNASPTELGVYGVGFTALRLIRAIQDGITVQPLNTYGAAMDRPSWRKYVSATGVFQLILALTTAMAAALLGWLLVKLGNDTAGPAVFSLWSAFLWWQLFEFIRRSLYTRSRVQLAALNTTISNIIRLSLMLWWVDQDQLTGVTSISAIAIGSFVALIPGIWQTRHDWLFHNLKIPETWKKNWNFGKWILGSSTTNWLAIEFYPVLTAGIVNFAAAGAYRALQNLVAPIHVLIRASDTYITPRAAKTYDQSGLSGLTRLLRTTYLILSIPVTGMLVIALLFPKQLLNLLDGETYLAFSRGAALMVIFYALLFAYTPVQTALKAVRIGKPLFIANIGAIISMFTIGVLLILNWGVYGTMAGQALNSLIIFVILWSSWIIVRRDL